MVSETFRILLHGVFRIHNRPVKARAFALGISTPVNGTFTGPVKGYVLSGDSFGYSGFFCPADASVFFRANFVCPFHTGTFSVSTGNVPSRLLCPSLKAVSALAASNRDQERK